MKSKTKLNKINTIIKTTLSNTKKSYYIIGISGGIDSLVALQLLINNVDKDKIKAYYLPIGLNNARENIKLIEQTLKINIETINLTDQYNNIAKSFNLTNELAMLNLKPKLRSMFLYAIANQKNGLVVSCLNYDEYYLGYFTKFGDSNGDLYPLINLTKTEIYNFARLNNLPDSIINQAPSADLYLGQTDEKEFNFTYKELDNYLTHKCVDQNIKSRIKHMHKINRHKHNLKQFIFKLNNLK